MKRILVLVAALLISWLVVPSTAVDPPPTILAVSTYAYDASPMSVVLTNTSSERGPPIHLPAASWDSVDSSSHGTVARSDVAPTPYADTPLHTASAETASGHLVMATPTSPDDGQVSDEEVSSLQRAGVAAESGDDLVDVWRAVGPDEAADIARSQAYKPGPGQIGKYFYPTREQAESLAGNYTKRGIGAPYTLTSGKVPRSLFDNVDSIHPAGEGPAWFFPNSQLPGICRVTCHGPVG